MRLFSNFFDKKHQPFYKKWWSIFGGTPEFNDYNGDLRKLEMVLNSPPALKVISLLCDMFSQGKTYVYRGEEEVKNAPEISLYENPNHFQNQSSFKWTYMFWTLIGNAILYVDKSSYDNNKLYFLTPHKISWPDYFNENKDKLFFSSSSINKLNEQNIIYNYDDGSSIDIPYRKIVQYFDLSNGTGNWFRGASRLDALCKIIQIADESLNAKMINLKFSGKFLVGGVKGEEDLTGRPLSKEEKESIEESALDDKVVKSLKNMFDIQRFVSDMGSLKLDDSYLATAMQIADMYGLPKEVIALLQSGSTYENQEKARAAVVSYCLEPKAVAFHAPLSKRVLSGRKRFVESWDHMPFMQYAERERAMAKYLQTQSMRNLQQSGVPQDEINQFLDLNFINVTQQKQQQQQGNQ